jgi:methyl-accepting chemotaxis protein
MVKMQEGVLARAQRPIFVLTAANTVLSALAAFFIMNASLTTALNEKEELLARNLATVLADPMSVGEWDRLGAILKSAKDQDQDMDYAVIVSQDGLGVASTDPTLKNANLNTTEHERMALGVQKFTEVSTKSGKREAIVPIAGPEGTTARAGILRICYSDKRAQLAIWIAEFIIIGLALLTLSTIIMLTRRVLGDLVIAPITSVGRQAERIAQGEIGEPLIKKNDDEIGRLVDSMNEMMNYLRDMSNLADSIAGGDLSVSVEPRSRDDVFGNAFKTMTNYLREMADLADSIADGDLTISVKPRSGQDIFGNAFKTMTSYLREMANLADSIARGDLSVRVDPRSADDLFGNAFKKMVDSLYTIIHQLAEDAQNLSSVATQLATTSNEQTTIISHQASSIHESQITLEQIRLTVNQASDKAKSVVDISEHTLEVSHAGQLALNRSIEAMDKIKDKVEEIARNMFELTTKTAQIGKITTSVNDLAEQSKLLAVNAAIEASRAGEFGRAFGVVALEVKHLANESKRATDQVQSILEEIQQATASMAMVTEEGTKRAESGVVEIRQIGDNFNKLYQVITESSNDLPASNRHRADCCRHGQHLRGCA